MNPWAGLLGHRRTPQTPSCTPPPSALPSSCLSICNLLCLPPPSATTYYLLLLSPRRVPSSPRATRHLPTLHLLPSVFSQRTHFAISNLQPLAERAPQTIDCIKVMISPQVHRNDETQLDHQTSCTQPLLRQFLW